MVDTVHADGGTRGNGTTISRRASNHSAPWPMPAVVFLRHAKSDWDTGETPDLNRPLADRGRRAAAAAGRFLAETGKLPDLALCSPAVRTHQTLELAMSAGNWTCPTETVDELYYGTVDDMVSLAGRRRAPVTMLVGHEPTISGTLKQITGADVRIPTAALAWVNLNTGTLEWLIPPRLLTDR
ncbi:SixA phosphatase family protein [Candidatus Poriferisocius sp.]|uniref:SixA phosphatase family protein n=1 Tax=Candidatus Poriferisocius sp. TaxID=3101276 RepID=UPI003B02DB29